MAEKNLDIILRARDKYSQEFKKAADEANKISLATVAKFVAGGAALSVFSKAAAAASIGYMSQVRQEEARLKGDVEALLEEQMKVNEAWAELGGAVPLVGEGVKKIIEELGNREAIRQMKQFFAEMEQSAKRTEASLENWNKLLKGWRYDIAGGPRAGERERDEANEALARIRKEVAAQQAEVRKAEAAYREAVSKRERRWLGRDQAPYGARGWRISESQLQIKRELAAAQERLREKVAMQERIERLGAERAAKAVADEQAKAEEKTLADRLRAEERERAERERAEADYQRQMAEQSRLADQARHAAAREAERQHREEIRAAEEMASTRAQLEDEILAHQGKSREVALRQAERHYAELRRKYAEHSEMLYLIDQAEAARRAEIMQETARKAGLEPGGQALAARESRFLTRAPGQDTPAWADLVNRNLREQKRELERWPALFAKLPGEIGRTIDNVIRTIFDIT